VAPTITAPNSSVIVPRKLARPWASAVSEIAATRAVAANTVNILFIIIIKLFSVLKANAARGGLIAPDNFEPEGEIKVYGTPIPPNIPPKLLLRSTACGRPGPPACCRAAIMARRGSTPDTTEIAVS
jgi:hypothetical protein